MSDLARQLEAHAAQLSTKIEGFRQQQGIDITVYLLMRSIRLCERAAAAVRAA